MNKKRQNAQDLILKYVNKIAPGGFNHGLYEDLFKSMSDKEFNSFMIKLRDKEITISIISPIDGNVKLDTKRNISIGKELGYDFFQHLTIGPKGSKKDGTYIPAYRTPMKYLVYDMAIRRTSQLSSKGISVGTNNNVIDLTTGQVTGDSKAAKLTKPEIELLVGAGYDNVLKELLTIRGGDLGASNASDASISRYGSVSQDNIKDYHTGVVSSKTMNSFFNSAHIKTEGLDIYK